VQFCFISFLECLFDTGSG